MLNKPKDAKKKGINNKLIIALIFIICIILACILFICIQQAINRKLLATKNDANVEQTKPEEENKTTKTPTIIANDIIIDISTQDAKLEFTTKNCDGLQIVASIEDESIATINEDYVITPIATGKTTIEICAYDEQVVKTSKSVNLTINDCVKDVTYKFISVDFSPAEYLYVGNVYYLQITEDGTENNTSVSFEENSIKDFSQVTIYDGCKYFKFTPCVYGEIKFVYTSKYISKDMSICSYIYPNDFEVTFDVATQNNEINLYLYNKDLESQAILDGITNQCHFNIVLTDHSNDIVNFNVTGDAISVYDNCIVAKSEGTCTITFTSTVSGVSKSYTINVIKVTPNIVCINNQQFEINTIANCKLKLNESTNFVYSVLPSYFYGEITTECDGVTYSENTITLTKNEGCFKIIYENNVIFTINFTAYDEYELRITCLYPSTEITSNTLTLTYSNNMYIQLGCSIYSMLTGIVSSEQEIQIEILDKSIITTTSLSDVVKNGTLSLKVLSKGTTTIRFYNTTLGIETTLTIIIE